MLQRPFRVLPAIWAPSNGGDDARRRRRLWVKLSAVQWRTVHAERNLGFEADPMGAPSITSKGGLLLHHCKKHKTCAVGDLFSRRIKDGEAMCKDDL